MSDSEWEWVDVPLANEKGIWRRIQAKKPPLHYSTPEIIVQLTPAQEATLRALTRKWRGYTLSRQPIDRARVAEAIRTAYHAVSPTHFVGDRLQNPPILFFNTLDEACPELLKQWLIQRQVEQRKFEQRIVSERKIWDGVLQRSGTPRELSAALKERHYCQPPSSAWSQLWQRVEQTLYAEYSAHYWGQPDDPMRTVLGEDRIRAFMKADLRLPDAWADHCSWIEFCIEQFHYHFNADGWRSLQVLVRDGGWFFPFDAVCLVCDRPLLTEWR